MDVKEPETLPANSVAATLPAPVVEIPAGEAFPFDADGDASRAESESLFERFGWLYAFFRERLFRDDTEGISAALWPQGAPPAGSRLLELGCGPGFYCCQFGERFRDLRVLGIDRSRQQLRRAQRNARQRCLDNVTFERSDALNLALEALDESLALGTTRPLGTVRHQEVVMLAAGTPPTSRLHTGARLSIATPSGGTTS